MVTVDHHVPPIMESKNMGAKKIEDKIVDAGLSLIGKKIKRGI